MELQEVAEPVLWLEDVDADADDLDLVERRWVEMRGIGVLDTLEGFVAVGVWVEVSLGGSRTAIFLPFSLILRSPDHTKRGALSAERGRMYPDGGQSNRWFD